MSLTLAKLFGSKFGSKFGRTHRFGYSSYISAMQIRGMGVELLIPYHKPHSLPYLRERKPLQKFVLSAKVCIFPIEKNFRRGYSTDWFVFNLFSSYWRWIQTLRAKRHDCFWSFQKSGMIFTKPLKSVSFISLFIPP